MMFAGVVFFLAGVCIVALFTLKRWERNNGRFLFPEVRHKADELALRIKSFLLASTRDFEKLPPYIFYILRIGVHMAALTFGHLAHWIGERSHDLADLVSHKHRFERRPPRSEFLKQVDELSMKSRIPREEKSFGDLRPLGNLGPRPEVMHVVASVSSDVPRETVIHDVPTRTAGSIEAHSSVVKEGIIAPRRSRKKKVKTAASFGENANI